MATAQHRTLAVADAAQAPRAARHELHRAVDAAGTFWKAKGVESEEKIILKPMIFTTPY
jgi:hypothetical protein